MESAFKSSWTAPRPMLSSTGRYAGVDPADRNYVSVLPDRQLALNEDEDGYDMPEAVGGFRNGYLEVGAGSEQGDRR